MIKKYVLLYFLILFSYCGFSQTNMLANGDLENWTVGVLDEWVLQEGDVSQDMTETTSGINSALLVETRSTIEPNIVSKNFLFEAGKTYRLSYDFKVKTGRNPFGQQVVGFKFGPVSSFPYSSGSAIPQGYEWESRDTEITVNVTEEWKLEISAFTFIDELFEVYIDNVKVIDINESNPDRDALVAFYNATGGDNWTNTWDLSADMSTWYGVTINSQGRVTELSLKSNNLIGTLPTELGNLTELTKFEINKSFFIGQISNSFSGPIPKEIGNLTKLKELDLGFMGFSGTIPPEFGQISALESLKLIGNNLIGSIPPELGQLSNLKVLFTAGNQLTGQIPPELGQLSKLDSLYISDNQLSGSIPPELGQLTSLTFLQLSNNQLTGTIPPELGLLNAVEGIGLGRNNLTGAIPKELGNLTSLVAIRLNSNDLSGEIPTELTQLSNLTSLDLSFNELTGTIPTDIGLLSKLIRLNLNSNDIDGPVPQGFSQISTLEWLTLSGNNLSGNLPTLPISITRLLVDSNSFVFEDLEATLANYTIPELKYNNQTPIGEITEISLSEQDEFSISVVGTTSTNNTYQWRKNEVNISGAINSSFSISNVQANDAGSYDCIISNSVATELTIMKNPIILTINQSDDDDNDGVTNNKDNCPNTPTGTTVDANGCPVTGTNDTDNDGVIDANDTCPNTPSAQSVDANGCSQSQLDDDDDGVTNNNDNCPNTPQGVSVDAEGCAEDQTSLPNIPNNGIQVKATSTSCPNSSNGEITISYDQDYSYTVQIKASLLDNTFDNVTSTNGLVSSELPADTYSVCITIPEFPSFEQCFTVVVETPEDFESAKTSIDITNKIGKVVVSGSKNYEVLINETKMNFSFEDTGRHELAFELQNGANNIQVKTDKNCQGEFIETVMLNSIRVFPNPTTDIVTILGLKNSEDATISISDLSGVLIKNYSSSINNTSVAINVAELSEGMYLVRVISNEQDVQTKIVKK